MAEPSFANYEEFFTFYLREQSHPRSRMMHAAGTHTDVKFLSF